MTGSTAGYEMTDRQKRVVENFKHWALAGGIMADFNRRNPERARPLEFKGHPEEEVEMSDGTRVHLAASSGFEVTKGEYSDTVFVQATVGKVGDEGTLGASLCRDYYHFSIGPKGGLMTPRKRGFSWKRIRSFHDITLL